MRYADEKEKLERDFQPRRRIPTLAQFFVIFAGLFVLILTVFGITHSALAFSFMLFLLLACVSALVTLTVQRSRDLVLATEYQNTIFSAALGIESEFCLIVRPDGSIIYSDPGVQKLLPNFTQLRNRTLDNFLEMGHVAREDINAMYSALDLAQPHRQIFTLRDSQGQFRKMVMQMDPFQRPARFMILRGRDFVSQRNGEEVKSRADNEAQPFAAFLSLYDRLPIGITLTNADGHISYANNLFCQWVGLSSAELEAQGKAIQQLIEILPSVTSDANGGPESGLLIQASGKRFPVSINQEKRVDAQGKFSGYIIAVYPESYSPDIERSAKRLEPHSEREISGTLPDMIANSPIAIVRADANSHIISVNKAFHTLTQHTLESSMPQSLIDLAGEGKREEAKALLSKILSGELSAAPALFEWTLPNNAQVTVSVYASRMQDEFILYMIDVTEQKNLELRFSHSQKMQAVGQLAGGVAHDFNNLLTAMIGFCDLLLMRHPAGDQSFADIMQIKQNANRAANLVRQLLAFSRRQTLQPKTLDITDVLAELSNLVRRLIGENIELKMMHGRDLGLVKADQGQLEQVIINLAVNARDAMQGGGVLTVRTSKAVIAYKGNLPSELIAPAEEDNSIPAGNYVLVEVIDTGTGIPRELIQKIFEPFFSTKEVGSGTGLGLSTVYGIIKQTGGYIYVASKEGEGTRFCIYFPAHQSATGIAPAAEAEAETAERAVADLTGRATILLVEDETPVRIFSARALRNKGYTILEADCAETALELMEKQGSEVEMIITDVIMPGMNGPTMVEKITEQYPNLKVIFISGYAEDVFMHSYGSERSFNFLAKPFTLKQLASKVKEVSMAK